MLLRCLSRESDAAKASGAGDSAILVSERFLERCEIAVTTFKRARAILEGLGVIQEHVRDLRSPESPD